MSVWEQHYKWLRMVPHYRTFMGDEFITDGITVHLPLFQDGQNITMERIWNSFQKKGCTLMYIDIFPAF
jgi:hypothetical protein